MPQQLTWSKEDFKLAQEIGNEADKNPSWFPKRHVIVLLLFFGMINLFILRVNLNVAVVDMTANKTILKYNDTLVQRPEFDWDSKTKGIVLSLFFYGYLLVMPFGGYLATKFGGVSTFGVGLFVTAIFTILTPVNLLLNFNWFAICRILEGSAEALCYTSTADICSRWTKPEERSKMVALAFSGVHIGVCVAFPLCGFVASVYGWPAIFYLTGGLSLVWFCFWIMLATNDPSPDDPDRKFLQRIWPSRRNQEPYPWKSMLTSVPLWILFLAKLSHGWGYNLMVQCFPLYIKDVTGAAVDKVGYLSAIPNFVGMITVPLSGYLIDLIINRNILTPTYAHKLTMSGSLLISAGFLIAISFMTNFVSIFIVFICFEIMLSFMFVTETLVPLYLSAEYSSGICGITSVGYTLANILSPTILGFMVTDHSTAQWNRFFTSAAILFVLVSVAFGVLSSSELQTWSEGRSTKNTAFRRMEMDQ